MAVRFMRSCDFVPDDGAKSAEHNADTLAELRVDGVTFQMDLCHDHIKELSECVTRLGFTPSKARVGHSRRGAYLTKSGQPFTTKQAREWLAEHGHEVSEVGRLTADQLQMYAQAH
jgi:hypothetical protein